MDLTEKIVSGSPDQCIRHYADLFRDVRGCLGKSKTGTTLYGV